MKNRHRSLSVKPPIILVDGREFQPERKTGIARFLEGLLDTLETSDLNITIILACNHVPYHLINRPKIKIKKIPPLFLISEWILSNMTKRDIDLFISPYPKLPLFGLDCLAINTIHDVLDLTHPAYKRRIKTGFDRYRLKRGMEKAHLTWYDSSWSLEETKQYAGYIGENPKVRYPGIDKRLNIMSYENQNDVLRKYDLQSGYILVIGNGLPHKNLGVILKIVNQLSRKIVFAGVPQNNQSYWYIRYPESEAIWINHVTDDDLPFLIKGSFCLAQPSIVEGYGYPPLEAMACGVPAIISNIPVLKETTGCNALIADPNYPEKWKEAIEGLENKDIYENQREKGLQWVEPLRGQKGWHKHILDIQELLSNQG